MAETQQTKRPKIALTGASGYIGRNLMNKLTEHADVIALSRNGDKYDNTEHVEWRSCDVFSMADAEKALKGADYAFYLVHSMMPSAKLTQGTFEDMDIILADNFAQAAKKNGVKQIVYLSGLMPEAKQLSRHLKSRLEVEKVLSAYGIPVTTIRAGLIVGPQGSSFPILQRLVKRLPYMILPKWTNTKTQPIALPDVLNALDKSVGNESVFGKAIDVGGPEVLTYKIMMKQTAEVLNKERKFYNVPFFTVKLSRLWVSLTTQTPKEMVYPLIESLVHPMVVSKERVIEGISDGKITFKEAALNSIREEEQKMKEQEEKKKQQGSNPPKPQKPEVEANVRSVQRVPMPDGKTAQWVAQHYVEWLPGLFNPFLRAKCDDPSSCELYPKFGKTPLLVLSLSEERSTEDRALYYITGGAFAKTKDGNRGRLEFRHIPGTNECIVAIHDYMPSLPWFVYQYTQAKMHIWVMFSYKKHLERYIKRESKKEETTVSSSEARA